MDEGFKRLRKALRIADNIITRGRAIYRGADLRRTKFGTLRITGPGNFTSEAGSVIGAMQEVDTRLFNPNCDG